MKSKKTKEEEAAPKAKVKIKSLKLARETLENLSDRDAASVKGGARTYTCGAGGCGGDSIIKK